MLMRERDSVKHPEEHSGQFAYTCTPDIYCTSIMYPIDGAHLIFNHLGPLFYLGMYICGAYGVKFSNIMKSNV
jgi:hypothetical protein